MADEISFAVSISGTKDGVTVSASVSDTQDLTGDVLFSDVLTLTATATYEAINWPAGLEAEGICGIMLIADPDNENEVTVASSNNDTYAFSALRVGGIPVMLNPHLDAAAGNPPIYVKSSWVTVAAKVKIVAVGQRD